MNVIVFEREEDIQDLLSYNLQKQGFSVQACNEKNVLCSCLDVFDPQLIIIGNLDWEEDLIEFAKNIRAKFKNGVPAILALTTDNDSIPILEKTGIFDKVLATPITPKYLIGQITQMVGFSLSDAA
ncbi:MAG: hypothetical protein MRZ79_16660 [Bacteroidia bacterium]|nr:hypothetical protein [Bacteroidia bacterium]